MTDLDEYGAPAEAQAPAVHYDLEAERAAVGAMLVSKAAVWEVLDVVGPTDFYQPKHATIARAVHALATRDEPTDAIAVSEELRRTGELGRAGEDVYLFGLTTDVLTTANAGYYAEIVKANALRRRVVAAGTRMVHMAERGEGDALALVDAARSELDLVGQSSRVDVRPVADTFAALVDSLEERPTFLPTPWQALTDVIGGFAPGCLYVVGARPGEGKTIVGLQAAARLSREGVVVFVSLEMSEGELQMRLISQTAEIHMRALRNHNLTAEDWDRLARHRSGVEGMSLFIDDHSQTLDEIRSYVRSVARRGKLAGVVVDYLQLVTSGKRVESRQQEVSEFSRQLKLLAKSLQVPVIALSQLNRSPEGRQSRVPKLSDLRESGAIEQDADAVLLLSYDKENRPGDLDVFVAKNRHGEMGRFSLLWQGHYARLKDKVWSPTAVIEREVLER